MSRKKRNKKRRILKVAILLLFIGAVSAAAYFYLEPEGETSEYDSPYEETTVQTLKEAGEDAYVIGQVQEGQQGIEIL